MKPIGLPFSIFCTLVLTGPVPISDSPAFSMAIGSLPERPMRGLFFARSSKYAQPYSLRIASIQVPK